jgi:hypothetical protein
MNRFAYANGNPISGIDPFGMMQMDASPNTAGLQPAGNMDRLVAAALGVVASMAAGTDPQDQVGRDTLEENYLAWRGVSLDPTTAKILAVANAVGGVADMTAIGSSGPPNFAGPTPTLDTTGSLMQPRTVFINADDYPVSAANLESASGMGVNLRYNPAGASQNRNAALSGLDTVPGFDLDEAPPAVLRQSGDPVIVVPTLPSDNRGAGGSMGSQLRGATPGQPVIIVIVGGKGG